MGRRVEQLPARPKSLQAPVQTRQQHKMRVVAFVAAVAGGATVGQYMVSHVIKIRMYDSALSGQAPGYKSS